MGICLTLDVGSLPILKGVYIPMAPNSGALIAVSYSCSSAETNPSLAPFVTLTNSLAAIASLVYNLKLRDTESIYLQLGSGGHVVRPHRWYLEVRFHVLRIRRLDLKCFSTSSVACLYCQMKSQLLSLSLSSGVLD